MFGDLGRVREKSRQLEETDAKYAPFVRKVCDYARNFEDEPILELEFTFKPDRRVRRQRGRDKRPVSSRLGNMSARSELAV